MKAQLARLPEWFEYFAALIRTHEGTVPPFFGPYVNYVTRVPLGVVAQVNRISIVRAAISVILYSLFFCAPDNALESSYACNQYSCLLSLRP